MRPISKTDFTGLSAVEMAVVDEVLEITSVKSVVGYFVPRAQMGNISWAHKHAKEGCCALAATCLEQVFATAQDTPDA